MIFIVAEKHGQKGLLLVVTDGEIIGKQFEEGKLQLNLKSAFYQGEKRTKEEVKERMEIARYLNFTGKNSVALGVECHFVEEKRIIWIANVPNAEVII
ncbi:DUF424 family protein [Candidatus Woesearchaeota archaeon]|nr:DUF424 family protein [Candidatus Woesearchaeota archaeon]